MNRIKDLFSQKENILSIYFTAGFPERNLTVDIIQRLEQSGVDMIEIGIPFSDPLADGPVIQHSSTVALQNGMTMKLLFEQLNGIRKTVKIPLIMMGYINPVMQYGFENFCRDCAAIGIDGAIIPDLPFSEYEVHYQQIAKKYGVSFIFLITPQTSESRIRYIDKCSNAFIYLVSSSSTTGKSGDFDESQIAYFSRVKNMNLQNPLVIGFGISNRNTFNKSCEYAQGAIIGSAFIKYLEQGSQSLEAKISNFVASIRWKNKGIGF